VKRAALVCAALALAGACYAVTADPNMPDFEVYWRAGARAAHVQPLYSADDGHYQLKYLPAFALLAVPLAWFPLGAAKAIWFSFSAALLAAFVAMSISLLPNRRRRRWLLLLCVVLAMAKFYGHELVLGQVNLLLGVLVAAAVLLLRRHRETEAGLLLALAIVVKPYALIFVPWVLAIERRRAFVTGVIGMASAVLAPAVLYGLSGAWSLHAEWWQTVTTSTAPNLLNADNVSFAAMYAKWSHPGRTADWLTALTSIVILAVGADTVRRRRVVGDPDGLEAALLLTMMPLLSPQGWDAAVARRRCRNRRRDRRLQPLRHHGTPRVCGFHVVVPDHALLRGRDWCAVRVEGEASSVTGGQEIRRNHRRSPYLLWTAPDLLNSRKSTETPRREPLSRGRGLLPGAATAHVEDANDADQNRTNCEHSLTSRDTTEGQAQCREAGRRWVPLAN
jgi:hypothetical protein